MQTHRGRLAGTFNASYEVSLDLLLRPVNRSEKQKSSGRPYHFVVQVSGRARLTRWHGVDIIATLCRLSNMRCGYSRMRELMFCVDGQSRKGYLWAML